MTVAQLIKELEKLPQDMPIAINDDISWATKDNPHHIFIENVLGYILIGLMINLNLII